MTTTKVKLCDAEITTDQIKTSWQSNGPDDWYEVKIIDKLKTRTQKQAKALGQQILENQEKAEKWDKYPFKESNQEFLEMQELKNKEISRLMQENYTFKEKLETIKSIFANGGHVTYDGHAQLREILGESQK